jgi:hypothetical protein
MKKKLNQKAIDRALKRVRDYIRESRFLETVAGLSDERYCALRAVEEIHLSISHNARTGDYTKSLALLIMAEVKIESLQGTRKETSGS